eukprot:g18874.t1
MWYIVSVVPDVAFSILGKPSGSSETALWSIYARFATNDNTSQSRTTSTPHFLDDMPNLGILQCHNDTTRKLEEQHLIFHLGTLQPNGLN